MEYCQSISGQDMGRYDVLRAVISFNKIAKYESVEWVIWVGVLRI